jgi:hypothetical protein
MREPQLGKYRRRARESVARKQANQFQGAAKVENTDKLRPCPDSEGLGCWGNEKITVGYVSEVNGPDSAEMPEFVPTRHELIQLVKYWATLKLSHLFGFFLHGQTGSNERRRHAFAGRRICRIATVLGEEEVRKAVEEAEDEFSKTIDPRAWALFKDGTPEEQEAFQDEALRGFSEHCKDTSGQADRQPTAE